MRPVAEHAEALEVLALRRRRTSRRTRGTRGGTRPAIGPSRAAPSSRSTLSSIGRPWQSQPGHVRRVEARHRPRLDDDVLQDLVERVADVDLAVGVGRPVVQDELAARPCGARGSAPYRSIASQRAIAAGSVAGRFAFIGKSVRGRLSVSFQSRMGIDRNPHFIIGWRGPHRCRLLRRRFHADPPRAAVPGRRLRGDCARHGIRGRSVALRRRRGRRGVASSTRRDRALRPGALRRATRGASSS